MNDYNILQNAKEGDRASLEAVVKQNEGLVWSVIRRFSGRGYDLDDLFQTGNIGLIKAVKKFDAEYGVKFSTYAVPLIMGEIKRFLRDDGMIKVSRRYKELSYKAGAVQERLSAELMRDPTLNEIAEALGVDTAELMVAQEACASWDSIYKTVCEGEKNDIYLIDTLANSDDEIKLLDSVSLKYAFSLLSEREQLIIKMRYFMDKTQSQVALRLGISQVQVSRIEKKVLSRLKENIKECV